MPSALSPVFAWRPLLRSLWRTSGRTHQINLEVGIKKVDNKDVVGAFLRKIETPLLMGPKSQVRGVSR